MAAWESPEPKGNDIKQGLLEKGLVEQEKVSVPKGSVTLLKLSDKGKNQVASWGIRVKSREKNASLTHEYYKEMVARDYEAKRYKGIKEYPLGGGKAVDLVATRGNERIAIEIETGKSDVKENIRKCKEAGFEEVKIFKI